MDWNNDGQLDIFSGCYWTEDAKEGQIQLLLGAGELRFEEATSLVNQDGVVPVNAELAEDAERDFDLRNICTSPFLVDYDADGDLDIINGCIGSQFFLHENVGTAEEPDFAPFGQELEVTSPAAHANPHLVDWDGDGDLDLLSGTANGGACYSENVGTREQPEWSKFKQLIAGNRVREQVGDPSETLQPGQSTRIWAYDWNRDGLLDLIVGDQLSLLQAKEGISQGEFRKRHRDHEQQMRTVLKRQEQLYESLGDDVDYENLTEEQEAKFEEIGDELEALEELADQFMESENTGFVWVYLRKPAVANAEQLAKD